MRQFMWTAVLIAFTIPIAHAQSASGTKGGTYDAGPAGQPPPAFHADQLHPANCGTPDDPSPCGPKPKKALKHYPAKSTSG